MRSGLLSRVAIARSHYAFYMRDRASQWRLRWEESGGGALMDIGVYCIHHLRQLIGKPIAAVQAQCHPPPESGECDITTTALLEFEDGTPAMLDASFDVNLGNGYTLAGPEGILMVAASFNQDGRGDVRWQGQTPVMVPEMQIVDPYRMEVEHFAACIQNDAVPMVRPEDSMDDVRVAMAIYESARTGKRVEIRR
jgi:xylose dehydrogenase (NAD/NADP)